MESWKTRLATLEDMEALQALIIASARNLNSEHYSPQQIESILKYVYGVDTQLIHDKSYFVVQDAETYIGCGGWSRRKTLYGGDQLKAGAADNLLDPATDAARIRAFFVHPDWARQGVGTCLMKACEEAAKEAGFKTMELMATLTGELLYTKFGFEVVEELDTILADETVIPLRKMRKLIAET
jgi:GNAT superfamily N-acetyltransferase